MEYKELAELYHMDASASRDTNLAVEERARRNAASTFSIGYGSRYGEMFIAVPRELSLLNETVLRAERKVSQLMGNLPGIASSAVLRGMVLDEVVCTNAIEDIHSTRRQVKDALESKKAGGKSAELRKFRELATLYLGILDGLAEIPQSPADVRGIYDKVMDGELDASKAPDGTLFRAEGVDITEGGVRVLHRGLEPESRIIEAIEAMISLARSDEIPATYAAIASHYLFEYAHPFYDGNGRTGRYLLSLFLSEPLSKPTALSLSQTIAENRNDYYAAFRTAENPLNKGELTFFVFTLLELVRKAQASVIERLTQSEAILRELEGKMQSIVSSLHLKPQEAQATFILMQYEAFGLMGDASVHELAGFLGVGEQMARKHLAELEKKGVVIKWRKRKPLTFALSDEFKARFNIESPDWRTSAAFNAPGV